jgi:hypothetical protein
VDLLRLLAGDLRRLLRAVGRFMEEERQRQLMTLISKDALWQAAADLPVEDVPLRRPDGMVVGTMRVRGLTGEEVNEWQSAAVHQVGKVQRQSKTAMAKLVVMSAIDEDGGQYFDAKDTLKVSQMPGWMLLQLTQVALKLSGLGDDDFAKELVEDFGDGLNGSSTSG